jgi:hypothetical protein
MALAISSVHATMTLRYTGQNVDQQNALVASARGARGGDIVNLAERQHLLADQARQSGPTQDADDHDEVEQSRADQATTR